MCENVPEKFIDKTKNVKIQFSIKNTYIHHARSNPSLLLYIIYLKAGFPLGGLERADIVLRISIG